MRFTGQVDESKKAPIDRWTAKRIKTPARARICGPRQAGTLWQRRMRSLALRLPKGRVRRDRSGAPMKRG